MIINDFYFVGTVCFPAEADTPLIVDTNGMLAFAVAFEHFQTVAWRNAELNQFRYSMQLGKLA